VTERSTLIVACLLQIVTYACFFNLTPLYPQVGHDLRLDAGALGALVGVGGIVALLVQLPSGSGGDRYGRRPFFALGMVLLLVSLLIRWQTQHALLLLLSQIAAGAALGIVSTNAFALMAGTRRQGQAFGIVNASISVGQVVGYLVAGTVGAALGWRNLSVAMLLLPLAALLIVLQTPALASKADRGSLRPGPGSVLKALTHPRRLSLAALAALTLGAGQGACYLLPFAVQTSDLGPLAAAAVLVPYVLGSVAAAPFSGALADRFGAARLIVVALALGVLACLIAVIFGTSLFVLALCNVLIGVSVNTTLPVVSVQVVSMRIDKHPVGAGTAMAGLRVGQSMGPFLGPTLAGAMLARSGIGAGWLVLSVFLVLSLSLHVLGQRGQTAFSQTS
jgi:predicted MFS family arabinose efflux permease